MVFSIVRLIKVGRRDARRHMGDPKWSDIMFSHILVPLDGSTLAECVLPHVSAFARLNDARVTLAHVLEPPTLAGKREPTDPVRWQLAANEAEQYLAEVCHRLGSGVSSAECRMFEGQTTANVVEYAQAEGVDLIALSSHGQSGMMGWNLGSDVHKLALHVRTSVLIVRAFAAPPSTVEPLRYRRLLLPLDGSRRAEIVLPNASHVADEHGAQLMLAHIIQRAPTTSRLPLPESEADLEERFLTMRRRHAERYLATVRDELASVGRQVDVHVYVDIDAVARLHDLADASGTDLVVVSAHGASGYNKWPFGTTVLNLLVYGTKPLLVIQDLPRDELKPSAAELAAQQRRGHG